MSTRKMGLLLAILGLLLLGCGFNINTGESATATPVPATDTAVAADTPAPTDTPVPAATVAPTAVPATATTAVEPSPTAKAEVATVAPTSAAVATVAPTRAAVGGLGSQGGVRKPGTGDAPSGGDAFEFLSHTAWVDDYGDISIVGEVRNVSDYTFDTLIAIQASLVDADGNPVEGDFGAYLDRPVIPPDEISSFWVYVPADSLGDLPGDSIADYELTLWVSEDPSPDVELTVLDAEAGDEGDAFYIRGMVENQTDMTFSTLYVYSTIYDADGNVVNATLDVLDQDSPLGPGDQAEFEGYFVDHYDEADTFYVFVTGLPTDGSYSDDGGSKGTEDSLVSGEGILEVSSHTGWVVDEGISIVGEVANVSDIDVDTLVMVEAKLYDADGNPVEGDFSNYLYRPWIAPGETSSFWIPIPMDDLGGMDPDSITDYELFLWITDQPSPDVELTVEWSDTSAESDAFYVYGEVSNQTDLEFVALAIYSTLYDADGNVVNATVDIMELDVPLGPGEMAEFEGYFVDHYDDADSFYVVVSGYTAE